MANTITNLIPDLYNALDIVSRELVGIIPAVTADMTFERAAVGQTVRSPVAPAASAGDITPAVTPPDDGDQTIGNVNMTITKARRVPVRWNGEQSLGLNNGGPGRSRVMIDQFAQAMRTLCNEVEADLAAQHIYASRAYGTAATTPFGTAGDFSDASNVLKVLKDNGAPLGDTHLILDTSAGAKLLGLQSRYDVAGDTTMQNQGVIVNKAGLMLRESAAILTPTAGSVTGAVTAGAAAIGATAITLTTGAGMAVAIVAGDVVTFAGDTNKYVAAAALTLGASTSGTLTLAAPGLRRTLAASSAITVIGTAARNMAFARSAIALATRAPALPEEGDLATDREIITDPRSGLSFEVSKYMQYRQVQYEVALAWGVKTVKPEHFALLLG